MIARRSGKIINIASVLGLVGDAQLLPYCVAKGGVVQMTRALASRMGQVQHPGERSLPGLRDDRDE